MKQHESISDREANNIMLSEWEEQSKNIAKVAHNSQSGLQMPLSYCPDVEITWVHTAHRYTISFELICHCLEICGLRKHTVRFKTNEAFIDDTIIFINILFDRI